MSDKTSKLKNINCVKNYEYYKNKNNNFDSNKYFKYVYDTPNLECNDKLHDNSVCNDSVNNCKSITYCDNCNTSSPKNECDDNIDYKHKMAANIVNLKLELNDSNRLPSLLKLNTTQYVFCFVYIVVIDICYHCIY